MKNLLRKACAVIGMMMVCGAFFSVSAQWAAVVNQNTARNAEIGPVGQANALWGAYPPKFTTIAPTGAIAIYGEAISQTDETVLIGVAGLAGVTGPTGVTGVCIGVQGIAGYSKYENRGINGQSEEPGSGKNIAVGGVANSSTTENVGLQLDVNESASGSETNYGVLAIISAGPTNSNSNTNYGIYTGVEDQNANDWAAWFDGDAHCTSGMWTSSDKKLKKNIEDLKLGSSIEKLIQLNPKSYEFRNGEFKGLVLPRGRQFGLIAQDLKEVFPQLVKSATQPEIKDQKGNIVAEKVSYESVNYLGLVPLLIGGIKDQQKTINDLSERLGKLEALLDKNPTVLNQQATDIKVDLNQQAVVLQQNVPNPFAEQTMISYFVPESAQTAQVMFYDLTGRVIKTVDVHNGQGNMTVYASDLSTGTYQYTLVVDGKQQQTKAMVKTK